MHDKIDKYCSDTDFIFITIYYVDTYVDNKVYLDIIRLWYL